MSTTPPRRRRPPAPPDIYKLALTTHPGYATFHKYEHYDEVLAKIERSAARGWPSHRGLIKNFVEHMDVLSAAREYLSTLPPERKTPSARGQALMRKVAKFDHYDYIKEFIDMHPQGRVRAELMVQLALHRHGVSKGYLLLLAQEPWTRRAPAYPPVQRRLTRHSGQIPISPHAARGALARAHTRLQLMEGAAAAHQRLPAPAPYFAPPPSPRARLAFELRAGIAAIEKQLSVLDVDFDQRETEREWLLARERAAEGRAAVEREKAPVERQSAPVEKLAVAVVQRPVAKAPFVWEPRTRTSAPLKEKIRGRSDESEKVRRWSEGMKVTSTPEEKKPFGGLLGRAKRWSCGL